MADFGQPFRDEKSMRDFVTHYKLEPWNSMPESELERYRITGHVEYTYFLPNYKEVHIIVIDKQ